MTLATKFLRGGSLVVVHLLCASVSAEAQTPFAFTNRASNGPAGSGDPIKLDEMESNSARKVDTNLGVLVSPTITGITTHSGNLNIGGVDATLNAMLGGPLVQPYTQMTAVSTNGQSAFVMAARSGAGSPGAGADVPVFTIFGLNDNTSQQAPLAYYPAYFEARRYPGVTGYTQGLEIGMVNLGPDAPTATSYTLPNGLTAAYWASAGRGGLPGNPTSYNPTVALDIIHGTNAFQTGIIFGNQAIATGIAIEMPQGDELAWRAPTGGLSGLIRSDSAVNAGNAIIFTGTGTVIQDPNGAGQLSVGTNGVSAAALSAATFSLAGTLSMVHNQPISWSQGGQIRSDDTSGSTPAIIFTAGGEVIQDGAGNAQVTISNSGPAVTLGTTVVAGELSATGIPTAANDGAAATAGVPVGGFYAVTGTNPAQLAIRRS